MVYAEIIGNVVVFLFDVYEKEWWVDTRVVKQISNNSIKIVHPIASV